MIVVTAAQMQAMDQYTIQELGIPGRVLMENAGRGATRCFFQHLYTRGSGRVGVLAGRGNNGGDGFVIARYLAQYEVDTTVFLLSAGDRVQGDAETNLKLLDTLNVPIVELPDEKTLEANQTSMAHMAFWIDAVFGTGLNDDVRGHYRRAIEMLNGLKRPTLAVDIPSGLNADTGQPCGICIQATATATFGYAKIGHLIQPGADYCGMIDVIDIGIPSHATRIAAPESHLITGRRIRKILPERTADTHKGRTGHVLVIAGSTGKTGAAALTAMATLKTGAGLVTLGAPQTINPILETLVVEGMTLPLPDNQDGMLGPDTFDAISQATENKQCIALGPGIGPEPKTGALVEKIVKAIDLPMVIDADGLNHLVGKLDLLSKKKAPVILTPHPGEMARLCNQTTTRIQADRLTAARELAQEYKVFVVLKGARSIVAYPDGRTWINPTGNSGMAGGGMGDVLTGVIAGLLAQGCTAGKAARAGVYLHGLAADLLAQDSPVGYTAGQVMDTLPRAIQQVVIDPPEGPLGMPVL